MPHAAVVLQLLCSGLLLSARSQQPPSHPNIVFFLTDDQDQVLGGSFPPRTPSGASPMPRSLAELSHGGATLTNMFIHTPICCPSRSETLTGRYLHNLKTPGECPEGYSGKTSDGYACCMHVNEKLVNNHTFAKRLESQAGYRIGMFGKYLNVCPDSDHVPPGFEAWFANGGGTYFSPAFAAKNIEQCSGIPDGNWKGTKDNYTTASVGNVSLAWIRQVVTETPDKPFLAYIAPKACHDPFEPAPWYQDYWNPDWPTEAPRTPSFNLSVEARAHHHPTIANMHVLSNVTATCIDNIFKNRWRTLMSVDDVIGSVIDLTRELGVYDNTYFLYSSDHGFQLGELNLAMDKRNVYDFDIRIHLTAMGPGIKPGTVVDVPATNVDLAPTILGLANVTGAADTVDGKSLVPFLVPSMHPADTTLPASVRAHLGTIPDGYQSNWRDSIFVEYYYVGITPQCDQGVPIEEPDNNFIAVRTFPTKRNPGLPDRLYAEFDTGTTGFMTFAQPKFYELYNLTDDPWQMSNIYNRTDPATLLPLHNEVHMWLGCKGSACP